MVVIAPVSEPASGSDIAKHPIALPAANFGSQLLRCSSDPAVISARCIANDWEDRAKTKPLSEVPRPRPSKVSAPSTALRPAPPYSVGIISP